MDPRRHLYHARINSHLTLQQIAVRTALSPSVLRNLDEGRFELLPSGVYARSYVRAFAVAVGLDPEITLSEVEHLLPGAPDPIPALNAKEHSVPDRLARASQQLLERTSAVVAASIASGTAKLTAVSRQMRAGVQLSLSHNVQVHGLPALVEHRITWQDTERYVGPRAALLERTPADSDVSQQRGATTPAQLVRCGASIIDALLLLVVDSVLVLLISWISGIPVDLLLREAGGALGAFCAVPVALYFVLFGGIAGSTLGRHVCSLMAPGYGSPVDGRPDHPLTLPDILRRAVRT